MTIQASPRLLAAAASTRTPQEVLAARRPARAPDVDTQTTFTVLCRWPNSIRLHTIEWETIETEAEALDALKQFDNAAQVFRHDYDVPRNDVSEDLALKWLRELIEDGFNPEEDVWPNFISQHISNDEAMREYQEQMPAIVGVRGAG